MIRTGDTIHNPVTGERITFRATSADTNGEAVVIECTVQPDGFVAATHLHPSQSERFAVIDGTLGLKNGKEKVTLERGEVAVVEPGTPHRFWNAGKEEVRFVCEVRPALQFESLLETMFVLAEDGKTNRKGMPNPPWLAVIAQAHFDTVRRPAAAGVVAEGGSGIRRTAGPSPAIARRMRRRPAPPQPSSLMRKKHFYHAAGAGADPAGAPRFAAAAKRVTGPALRFA
jgi:mannose-6-phosphate isomerase-like protein (cupin superfamily)